MPKIQGLKKMIRILLSAGIFLVGMSLAIAQEFPTRAVKFIVPFPPGSGTDTSARYYGKKFTELTGQPVIVENRPGANGIIAVKAVLAAPADGYTVFIGSNSTLAVNVALIKSLPYDPQVDFLPLTMMMRSPTLLVTAADSQHKSVKGLIQVAKTSPGKLNYASGSAGYQLMAELFNEMAGVETNNIPYKGASEALTSVTSNTVDFAFSDITAALELVKGGKLNALAITSEKRLSSLPQLPTVNESGLIGFSSYTWVGAMVSSKTPKPEYEKLVGVLSKIVALPETKDFYEKLGAEVMKPGPDVMRNFQASEIVQWKRIVTKAKVEQQ